MGMREKAGEISLCGNVREKRAKCGSPLPWSTIYMEWTLVLFDVESIPLESKCLPLEWVPGLTSESVFYPLRWMCYILTMAGSLDLKIYSRVHENAIFPTEKKRRRNIDFSTRYRAVKLHHFEGRSNGDWFGHLHMPFLHAPRSLKLEQRIAVCHISRNLIT